MTNVKDIYELSPLQESMLADCLLTGETRTYLIQLCYGLQGNLEESVLLRSFQEVVGRHPVLRTSIHWEETEDPVQVVHKEATLPAQVLDWRAVPADQQQARLESFLEEDRSRGMELGQPPLMRLNVIQLSEERWTVVWTFHHILMEGWSAALVLDEVLTCYRAICREEQPGLPPAPAYRDYILWLQRQDPSAGDACWRQELDGLAAPAVVPIGSAGRRRLGHASDYRSEELRLSSELTAAIQEQARKHGLTLNTLVHGAWALLLGAYGGGTDVQFGTVVSGRSIPLKDVDKTVGLFINTLPTRVRIPLRDRVSDWLARLQRRQAEMRQYEFAPLQHIKGLVGVDPGVQLFESIVIFENWAGDIAAAEWDDDLEVTETFCHQGGTGYPIALVVDPGPPLSLAFNYDSERFEIASMRRMLGHLSTVLEAFAADLEQTVERIEVMTEPERDELGDWNRTGAGYPDNRCIHELFDEQARTTPDSIAVVGEDEELTFRELERRSNQLARYLRQRGVGPETRVGVCVERSAAMIAGLLGILKAGGAYVPLDPAYPRSRLDYMLEDSQIELLLTQGELASKWPPQSKCPAICLDRDQPEIEQEESTAIEAGVGPDNLLCVIYTSGSTGRPKGVQALHRGAVNRFSWMWSRYPFAAGEVCSQKTSLSFVDSIWELFGPLLKGVPIAVVPEAVVRGDPDNLIDYLADRGVTRVVLVPSLLQILLGSIESLGSRLPRLQHWVSSGEALSGELAREFFRRLPGRRLINLYGSSEVAADCTCHEVNPAPFSDSVSIGRPIHNMRTYVLDSRMRPTPVGVMGEIYVGGAGLARGYLNRAAATAGSFIPDPFSGEPGARLYRTGDLGRRLPDGNLEFVGRADHQVKVRGFRVELAEIELRMRQHPRIKDAVAILRKDENDLVGYVVADNHDSPGVGDLRRFLSRSLPEYMVPSVFVQLDALPLSPNGKVDRQSLPAPDGGWLKPGAGDVPPRTPMEKALAAIWKDLLRLDQVGIHDNFFELGGHSLTAVRLLLKIRKTVEVELPLSALLESPTIAELALRLDGTDQGASAGTMVAIQPDGSRPPFFCIHGHFGNVLLFADLARHLGDDQPFYGVQSVGLERGQRPLTRIETMAGRYIEDMRSIQPEGPYFLGAYCFGAVLAFEMARQLSAQGQQVAFLGAIDVTPHMFPQLVPARLLERYRQYEAGSRLARYRTQLRYQNSLRERASYLWTGFFDRVLKLRAQYALWRLGSSFSGGRWERLFSKTVTSVGVANLIAKEAYTPGSYEGDVTLFQSQEVTAACSPDPEADWAGLATGRTTVRLISDGGVPNIGMLFKEPCVSRLAEEIAASLDQAGSGRTVMARSASQDEQRLRRSGTSVHQGRTRAERR